MTTPMLDLPALDAILVKMRRTLKGGLPEQFEKLDELRGSLNTGAAA